MTRLIDADRLLNEVTDAYDSYSVSDAVNKVCGMIINAPTASADRPHGHWIVVAYQKDGEEYIRSCTCSECGSKSVLRTNFCDFCGADMRGEKC